MLSAIFGDKKKREAAQLNRDAPLVIQQAEQLYASPRLRMMAGSIANLIERVSVRYGTREIDLKRAHFDYRSLHKEARRKNDQVGLSVITLAIIYIRAKIAGPGANPACAAIDIFLAKWRTNDENAGEITE